MKRYILEIKYLEKLIMESFLGILETLFNVISFVGRSGCRVWEMMEVGGGSDKKEGLFGHNDNEVK